MMLMYHVMILTFGNSALWACAYFRCANGSQTTRINRLVLKMRCDSLWFVIAMIVQCDYLYLYLFCEVL